MPGWRTAATRCSPEPRKERHARVVVVLTGAGTVLGGITSAIGQQAPETDFERGVTRFAIC